MPIQSRHEFEIRRARQDDSACLAEFNRALAMESEGKVLEWDRVVAGVGQVIKDSSKGVYYVAVWQGAVAGQLLVTYEWSDWSNGTFWWIQSLYVTPELRKRGVCKALLDHVRGLARESPDACGLRLYVEHGNTVARRAYEKLGWRGAGYEVFEWVPEELQKRV